MLESHRLLLALQQPDGGRFGGQRTKQKIQQLHAVIEEQQQLIDQLLDRLADHENSNPRAQPAIR